jgi:plastocyanin
MRFLCASFALGVGLLGLIPESAQACHRRGGSVAYAPVQYGYAQPMYPAYYPPGAYYAPGGLPPPTVMPAVPATNVDVAASDDKFEPVTITVAPGTTVRWTNKGTHKHTVTSATGAWDSGDLAPNQVYSATFTRPGTFEYYCKHHRDMKGTIIVK